MKYTELYRESREPFREELFQNPTEDYRGVPFWAWNGELDKEEMKKQIAMFRKMGFGGVHIHSRTGLETEYLSEEYMKLVQFSLDECKENNLRVWLYDEDRWPSGSAGGKVTEDEAYRTEYLLFTPVPYGHCSCSESCPGRRPILPGRGGARQENGTLLAVYDVKLDSDGLLDTYQIWKEGVPIRGTLWYAYLEKAVPAQWFNNKTYVNVLDRSSIQRFTEITHDAYAKYFENEFGGEIPAIFTDEPQHVYFTPLAVPQEQCCKILPWTHGFEKSFYEKYGFEILEMLPELFWEVSGRVSFPRYAYHNHVADLFAENYCGTLQEWCSAHGIALTGHLMWEPTLQQQATFVGDVMRCYPQFDIPGIDILCDDHEYNTAKQAQSVAHQTGAPGLISELYGETGWDFDFRGHKLQGDWQAALGVTIRVPHLSWFSMKGEAKRDYPATISYQSPWWEQYSYIEDYFARINTLLTRGKASVSIGVIHPIESFYLHMGPESQTYGARRTLDEQFAHISELLLFHQLDFDYINEATLPMLGGAAEVPGGVGQMRYEVIVVAGCETLRDTTIDFLECFTKAGGKVLFIGKGPSLVNAKSEQKQLERLQNLYRNAQKVEYTDAGILEKLEPYRFLSVRKADGKPAEYLLHQVRAEGDERIVFIARGKNPVSGDVDDREKLTISFSGKYRIREYDALTGKIHQIPVKLEQNRTVLERVWFQHDSLLLWLEPETAEIERPKEIQENDLLSCITAEPTRHFEAVCVKLEEPNACLLDIAEFSLDGNPYEKEEELLRLDNLLRARLGLPKQSRDVVQPYEMKGEAPEHQLSLRFTVDSEVESLETELALENPRQTRIVVNGVEIASVPNGFYVDRCIEKVKLPALKKGKNTLEIMIPFGRSTFTEWCYLLGNFGVRVSGIRKTLTAPVRTIAFGDVVPQGLPFYTGNFTYSFSFDAEGDVLIRIPRYRGAVLGIWADDGEEQLVAFSPYICRIRGLAGGSHTLYIRVYNTRQNGFGPLHHTDSISFPQHPNSWRSTGDRWTYEYQLRSGGILASPEIYQI